MGEGKRPEKKLVQINDCEKRVDKRSGSVRHGGRQKEKKKKKKKKKTKKNQKKQKKYRSSMTRDEKITEKKHKQQRVKGYMTSSLSE